MTKLKMLTAAVAISSLSLGSVVASAADKQLSSHESQYSYAIGLRVAENFKAQDIKLDTKAFFLAIEDIMGGKDIRMTDEALQTAMNEFNTVQQAKMQERQVKLEAEQKVAAEKNVAEGAAFLAKNAKEKGVKITESGLQYKVITQGEGAKPTTDSVVSVHYRGRLLDGTEFDSSYKRGQPAKFGVTQVIKGWTEALQLMPEGSKYELYIPSDLAYGPRGAGANIGPNATLIFEVELLSANAN